MLRDTLIWLGELMFGVGHVSETALLITVFLGAAITISILAVIGGLMIKTEYKDWFGLVGVIVFFPALYVGMLPSQAAIIHEGRFSECETHPLTIAVDSVNLTTEATYCRYKEGDLNSDWQEWQLLRINYDVDPVP